MQHETAVHCVDKKSEVSRTKGLGDWCRLTQGRLSHTNGHHSVVKHRPLFVHDECLRRFRGSVKTRLVYCYYLISSSSEGIGQSINTMSEDFRRRSGENGVSKGHIVNHHDHSEPHPEPPLLHVLDWHFRYRKFPMKIRVVGVGRFAKKAPIPPNLS